MFALPRISAPLSALHKREHLPEFANWDTAKTIRRMRDLVSQGKRDYQNIHPLIADLTRNCAQKDFECYIRQAFNFVLNEIQYVYDPAGVETIVAPWMILKLGKGDCDCKCVLLATLLEGMGFEVRFITIADPVFNPDKFVHVFLKVRCPGRGWICLDATEMNRPFGWCPPMNGMKKEWSASNDQPEIHGEDMSGLGCCATPSTPITLGCSDKPCDCSMNQMNLGAWYDPRDWFGDSESGASAGTIDLLEKVLDGSEAARLKRAITNAQLERGDAETALEAAHNSGDFDQVAAAQSYVNDSRNALSAIQDQKIDYNSLANTIETGMRSLGYKSGYPPNLGIAPIVAGLLAIGAVIVALERYFNSQNIAATAVERNYAAKANYLSIAKSAGVDINSIGLNNPDPAPPDSFGGQIQKVLCGVAILGALYVGFSYLKKKGKA